MQKWVYDDDSGLIKHSSGKCIDASQRDVNNGIIHLWDCDESNKNQKWEWTENKQHIKNRYGRCMDAPNPTADGSGVHMWKCHQNLKNQKWLFLPADGTFTTTSSISSSTTEDPSTTMPTSTSTTTPRPLRAVRNCQLEPLVNGSGCIRVAAWDSDAFGVGENGQETQGRHKCLEMMRSHKDADTFVHSLGRCELWRCVTQARLEMSAGPGGALSSSLEAVAFKSDLTDHYLTANQGGGMDGSEESFVPEALFYMKEVALPRGSFDGIHVTLKSKANGKFLKAEPGGHLAAVTEKWDDWEVFHLESNGSEGTVSLKSFHHRYVTVDSSGSVWAGATSKSPEAIFHLENRSRAATVGMDDFHMLKTVSMDATLPVVCAYPTGSAAVRCCKGAEPVPETTYGCDNRKTFHEALAICQEHGLTLCAEEHVKSCDECSRCAETGEHQQIWTKTPCSSTESATQRRLNLRNDRAAVFSQLCSYESARGGLHGEEPRATVLVKLMEWNYDDIAKECTNYLAPNGFEAVQVSPVTEHVLGYQWWVKYQPVSAGLDSRSGTEADFRHMVQTCRAAGVQVIVDILMNHMAGPCEKARDNTKSGLTEGGDEIYPCTGWGGSKFGDRRQKGARGWDASGPEHFHHGENVMEPLCKVGPQTGWLCPNDDCTPCDMYRLPDYNTELQEVRDMQFKHLEELYHIGVTGLRVDAAIYHHVYELADMLNRVPWDLIYQEWWGEYPPQDRTDYVGLYRDVGYRWHVVNRLSGKNATDLPEVLDLKGGVFGISEDMAVYPFAYHDGRSKNADPEIATYKNGLAFHQQQKFFLSWTVGSSVLVWGGYGWRDLSHGPPGCDKADGDHCTPKAVYDDTGTAQCMEAPTQSPMPTREARERRWICEHRWQGVAGMIHFRKACRGKAVTQTWKGGITTDIAVGRLAFRLASDCFVALVRGRRTDEGDEVNRVGVGGHWDLQDFQVGLPAGLYCDLSSLHTQKQWHESSPCPRSVRIDSEGRVQEGGVSEGEILAIHIGARSLSLTD